eukprot:SAG31_NODE_4727_length_3001_cov_3.721916_2_plen_67_part_00
MRHRVGTELPSSVESVELGISVMLNLGRPNFNRVLRPALPTHKMHRNIVCYGTYDSCQDSVSVADQ